MVIINVECRFCSVLFMLSVILLIVVNMLCVVILNVVTPQVEIAWKNVPSCLSERQ
jgi:hypothetical protein